MVKWESKKLSSPTGTFWLWVLAPSHPLLTPWVVHFLPWVTHFHAPSRKLLAPRVVHFHALSSPLLAAPVIHLYVDMANLLHIFEWCLKMNISWTAMSFMASIIYLLMSKWTFIKRPFWCSHSDMKNIYFWRIIQYKKLTLKWCGLLDGFACRLK